MPNFARIIYYLTNGLRRLYWSEDKLRKYQEKRLRSVVRYAYHNVPFYHQKFKEAQISPFDINTLDDLTKLPVFKKDELRSESLDKLVSSGFQIEKLKVFTTSGSTGKPFRFYISRKEGDWRKAIYLRANISCGQKPRDRWAFITAPRHFADTSGLQLKLGIFAQRCVSIFEGITEQTKQVGEINPDVLDGYSGALFLLAKEIERQKIKTIHPRLIFGSAELIDLSQSKYLEQIFGAPYYDQLGCAEVNRTAWQCPEKTGYHMDVDSVITQCVDNEGNDVSSGESGEIVYTSLFNYAMPFIRYSVGDVGKISDETCSCGRIFPLIEVVEGRKDSQIVLPNGSIISPRTLTVAMSMFSHYEDIEQFRVIQEKLNFLRFLIKRKENGVENEIFRRDLVTHFEKMLGLNETDNIAIELDFVDVIPSSPTGKLQSVVSNIKADF